MSIDIKALSYSELIRGVKSFQKHHGLVVDGIIGKNTKYEMMFYKYPNFKKEEFKCNCGGKYCDGYPAKVDELLIAQLELLRTRFNKPIIITSGKLLRTRFNKPIIITSGVRCKEWNKEVGGVSNSQHLKGKAADIKIEGVNPKEVQHEAEKVFSNGGVGSYKTFTHVDTRKGRVRFKG